MKKVIIKSGVAVLAVLCLTGIPYLLLGLINRLSGNGGSIFYCYAGSRNFVHSYGAPFIAEAFRWRPTPIGLMYQDGIWGLVLASSATEADFTDPAQIHNFRLLQTRIGRIAQVCGAQEVHLAGILPGLLRKNGAIKVADTRPQVVAAVTTAVERVAATHMPRGSRDIILLGGAGFIGRAICATMAADGWHCHTVDTKASAAKLPDALRGKPALLLDVARKGAIAGYIPQMWPGLIVLNEVFPAPARRDIAAMQAIGVQVLHLAGVAGRIMPPLPHGYEGAVPCCASRPTAGAPDVVIRTLTPLRPV